MNMEILENMTVSEKHNYERMKKQGHTDEEIKEMLLTIRSIPPESKKALVKAVKKSIMENLTVEIEPEE